jgi:DNA-binding ferritin-like protein
METKDNNNDPGRTNSPEADFGSMLHSGGITNEKKAKDQAAQYSLSLIQASDPLISEDSEKIPDVDATLAVMKEFGTQKVEKTETRKYPCSNEMLKELIKDHERIINQLKKKMTNYYERYKDLKLRNMINGIIEEHKTVAWTLKRFLVG